MQSTMHVYEVRPRKDHRGVDLISDALPFGRLWYAKPDCRPVSSVFEIEPQFQPAFLILSAMISHF
jgi:hypothetical protein